MNKQDTDLAYSILDIVLESFEGKPEIIDLPVQINNTPRPKGISLSSAGRELRYLAHMANGSPKKDGQPRYMANLDMGTIAHEYLRHCIGQHPNAEIVDAERKVGVNGIPGHIDGFLKFDGLKVLIDIKCYDHYTHNSLDPRNTETNWWAKARKWNAGNYVFDAVESFKEDAFKKYYLGQIAAYEAGLQEAGEDWDATAFIMYNRNTSHIAIGIYNPETEEEANLIQDIRANIEMASSADSPYDFEPCHEAAEGAGPHIVCQYCPYLNECFSIKTTTFRGKPNFTIKEIR